MGLGSLRQAPVETWTQEECQLEIANILTGELGYRTEALTMSVSAFDPGQRSPLDVKPNTDRLQLAATSVDIYNRLIHPCPSLRLEPISEFEYSNLFSVFGNILFERAVANISKYNSSPQFQSAQTTKLLLTMAELWDVYQQQPSQPSSSQPSSSSSSSFHPNPYSNNK